jgi:hypothetical protein
MAEIKHDNRLYALEQVCVCPCLCYSVTKSVIVSLLCACVCEMNISYRHMHACKHASVCVRVCVCVCVCVMRVFLCVHMQQLNVKLDLLLGRELQVQSQVSRVTIPTTPTTLVRQFTRTDSPSESITPPATPSPKSLSPTHTPREEDVPSQMHSKDVEQPEIQPSRAATLHRLTQRSTETPDSPPWSLFQTSIQEHENHRLCLIGRYMLCLYLQRPCDRGKKETLMAISMHARDTGGMV